MNDVKQINAVRNAAGTFILYCVSHYTETLMKNALIVLKNAAWPRLPNAYAIF